MEKEKIDLDGSVITVHSPEYHELIATIRQTSRMADKVLSEVQPSLFNERYLTTNEVIKIFRICRRALQNYRDRGEIPYISIGRVILYPESMLKKTLEKNYSQPLIPGF